MKEKAHTNARGIVASKMSKFNWSSQMLFPEVAGQVEEPQKDLENKTATISEMKHRSVKPL